jgi:hypothetical protein
MTLARALLHGPRGSAFGRHAAIAFAVVSFVGCAGQPFAAPIQDEPICSDFELGGGHVKMEGALEYPIQVRFLEGKTQLQRVVLHGRRGADAKLPKSFLPDDNAELTVEWAQCSNQWAPRPASTRPAAHEHERDSSETTKYECGEATVYKTETLVIKKKDSASHVVHFALPKNNAGCWKSDATPEPPKPATGAAPSADPAASAAPSASVRAEPPPRPTK